MTGEQIGFIILSALMLGSAYVVVTDRNLFRAALAMMASFLFVAGMYITLDAGFMAAAQLLVYIGAISILVIFAIMMTRRLMAAEEPAYNSQKWFGLATAVFTFVIMVAVTVQFWSVEISAETVRPVVSEATFANVVVDLGETFVSVNGYVLPFEIASVLLLAAMIGAIVIAWPTTREDEIV